MTTKLSKKDRRNFFLLATNGASHRANQFAHEYLKKYPCVPDGLDDDRFAMVMRNVIQVQITCTRFEDWCAGIDKLPYGSHYTETKIAADRLRQAQRKLIYDADFSKALASK